ncbi:MAG: sugar phosphate isomerase/epimerase [Victivallaceae bacterium]|nr:sugar phosphate isomerase/epimerase [Victivallaceae bacterium]
MKLVLSTRVFNHIEINCLSDLFPLIRKAGFRYLEVVDRTEFDDNVNILDDLREQSKEYGIEILNWHLIQYSPFQKSKEASRIAIDSMKYSMDKGSRIGAKNHVLHWYQRFLDKSYDIMWRDIVDEWADHAKKLGIRLLMETVPDKASNQRYVSSSEIINFVRSYLPEVLAMCIDVNHSNLQEKLPNVVHKVKDRLISLHISDNDGHEEKHWLPGQGLIDFTSFFESLEAIKFDGMLVMEVKKWCNQELGLAEIKSLYEFGISLLETKRPHPNTPLLIK